MRALAFAAMAAIACGGASRDVIPESRDVTVKTTGNATGAADKEGYEYVARRPLAVVALAEARGIDRDVAVIAIERLADRLDACVTDQAKSSSPPVGAARLVARLAADGTVADVNLRVDPGAGAATSAVLCLVAPAKLLVFPPSTSDTRGLALEAIWGHLDRGR